MKSKKKKKKKQQAYLTCFIVQLCWGTARGYLQTRSWGLVKLCYIYIKKTPNFCKGLFVLIDFLT